MIERLKTTVRSNDKMAGLLNAKSMKKRFKYAECKVNAEENLKVLASQHSLELSTAKDKLKQIIKSAKILI